MLAYHIDANSWDVAVMTSSLCANDRQKVTYSGVYDFCMRTRTHDPITTSLMTSVTKNPHPPTKKIFFE